MTARMSGLRLALAVGAALTLSSCGGSPTTAPASSAERGEVLAGQRGCVACHSVTGRAGVGPTWKGLAGSTVALADGSQIVADEAYLARSIREPSAQIVKGFTTQMPQLGLADSDVVALVAYIESLR